MRGFVLILFAALLFAQEGEKPPSAEEQLLEKVPRKWRSAVKEALKRAGGNKGELIKALSEAKEGLEFEVVAFCVAQSAYRYFGAHTRPVFDCTKLTAKMLLENARRAIEAWRKYPWAKKLNREKFLRFVAAYRNETEKVCEFRKEIAAIKDLAEKMGEFVKRYEEAPEEKKARIFRELVWFVNTGWLAKRMRYRPRQMPDLNPLETLKQGWGRCTDLTNTLIAILRTYGIAATSARCIWWPKEDGNHLWTLVWSPDEKRWLSIDSACGGRCDNPGYFKKFIFNPKRPVAKVFVSVPGEERGENIKRCGEDARQLPPLLAWYLLGRPAVDWTDRFAKVVLDVPCRGLERGRRYFLCVFNSGGWRALDTALANDEGVATFKKVGVQVETLFAVCKFRWARTPRGLRPINIPVGPPFILKPDGSRKEILFPEKFKGEKTTKEIPNLPANREFTLYVWTEKGWKDSVKGKSDDEGKVHLKDLVPGALYILVYKTIKGRMRALRPFVVER